LRQCPPHGPPQPDYINNDGTPGRAFDTIEKLHHALLEFRNIYNTTRLIERHGFISPAAFRQQQVEPAGLAE
jgi:Integrase core domain